MALFETVLVSDLKKPVQVKELTGNLFSADNNGNKITVSVMDNGAAAQITGNVTGYVIRSDGKTVIVEGELVGNMASIILPASAYTVIGRVSIVVKVGTTTVGACTSNVYRSTTDEIVDPGHVVPDITELLEKIAECEAATAAAEAAAIAAGYVDIDMSKTGKTITVSITNKNNQTKTQTIVEPTITVAESDGTVTITAVDADGTTTVSYDITPIDDTAGDGDTDKVWSADKTHKEISDVKSALTESKADIINVTDSASAPVKTLTDGADGVPMEVTVAINPVQDLHGQESPYPEGAGKNKCPMTLTGMKTLNTTGTWNGNVYSINGISFTVETDDGGNVTGIKTGGVPSATTVLSVASISNSSETIKMNGCPAGGGATTNYKLDIIKNQSTYVTNGTDTGEGTNAFTLESDGTYTVRIIIYTSNPSSSLTFKPMIRLATESDATFAPYSNICPISGWTEAELSITGKNFIDLSLADLKSGYCINNNGVEESNLQYSYTQHYYKVNGGGTVAISFDCSGTSRFALQAVAYDAQRNYIDTIGLSVSSSGRTRIIALLPEGTYFIRFNIPNQYTITNMMLEYNSMATAYEPFGTTYTIQFGETVYGGTLTVNKDGTGTLSASMAIAELSNFTIFSTGVNAIGLHWAECTGIAPDVNGEAICSLLGDRKDGNAGWGSTTECFAVSSDRVRVYTTETTRESFLAKFAGLQVCYTLATPVIIPLSAPIVRSLLGVNNLYADTGDILSVDYSADTKLYVDKLFASLTNATGVSF